MKFFEKGEFKLLWRLYFGNFITSAFHLIPAFGLVYLIGLGMSLTQAGILFSSLLAASIIFEIPTGAIADKYGRKFSVLLGGVLESLLVFSVFFTSNYYALLIIFISLGIAGTLSSGSGESWIYDLIIKTNKKILHSYYSKHQLFGALGLVISGFVGAFVVGKFGINWIWLVSGIASFAYFCIIFSIPEIYTTKKEHKDKFNEIWKHSLDSVRYSLKHKIIFWLLLAGFIMMLAVAFSDGFAYVPYLKSLGFPDYAFGYYFSGISLVAALAPLTIKFIRTKRKEIKFLIWATFLGSVLLLLLYLAVNYIQALIILFLSSFFFCAKYPIEQPFLNSFIPTKMRATILSFKSMIYSLAGVIALPIAGFLVDKIGALNTIGISALLGIPSIIAYLMIRRKN